MPDIFERIKTGDFNSKVEYPTRVNAPSGYTNTVENIIKKAPKGSELEELEKVGKDYLNYLNELEEWKTAVAAWKKSESEGIESLRRALEEEHGLTNHPKAGNLWAKAWEEGHSFGLSEVAYHYEELLDLVV